MTADMAAYIDPHTIVAHADEILINYILRNPNINSLGNLQGMYNAIAWHNSGEMPIDLIQISLTQGTEADFNNMMNDDRAAIKAALPYVFHAFTHTNDYITLRDTLS